MTFLYIIYLLLKKNPAIIFRCYVHLTFNEPVRWWIRQPVTLSRVKSDFHTVVTRFQEKEQYFICAIGVIRDSRTNGRTPTDQDVPRVSTNSFKTTADILCLNEEPAELPGRPYIQVGNVTCIGTCSICSAPSRGCLTPFCSTLTRKKNCPPIKTIVSLT